MKLSKYGIILLVVIGLFLISRLGCNNGLGFFDKPKADTVRVIDTLWEQHDTTIYKKVPVKEIIYDIDTLPPQLIPDTNYAALKLQFEALVKEHASKAIFFDTIKLAELKGGFYLKDTVQFNRLAGRSVEAKYEIPVVKETVTITKQAPKKNQLYIGAGINTSKTLMPQAAEAGLILKTKRDQIYGVKAGTDINGNISYGFQSYWKIGKKDK
jgi:hypothetical protein